MARGPHLAREAVLRGPQSLFAIDFLMDRLTILWQTKRRSKPKPSSVWFSRNQFKFAAKTFFYFGLHLLLGTDSRKTGRNQYRFAAKTFFFDLHQLLGQIPEILAEMSTDFVLQSGNYL